MLLALEAKVWREGLRRRDFLGIRRPLNGRLNEKSGVKALTYCYLWIHTHGPTDGKQDRRTTNKTDWVSSIS